jgi:hypothetical protein
MRHASVSRHRHAKDYEIVLRRKTGAEWCSSVVGMRIIIIIIPRVRDEAELGDQMLGRSAATPQTQHSTARHSSSDDDTNTKESRASAPLALSPHNYFLNLTSPLPDHLTGTSCALPPGTRVLTIHAILT